MIQKKIPMTITKTQLKALVETIVKEQVDMRTKDGRELKDLASKLMRQQKELDLYNESIKDLLERQKKLKNLVSASEKILFGRMQILETKTVEITEAIFRIEDEDKYKRVEPGYKPLYEKAIQQLARFSEEQVMVLESAKETEITLKKAERVSKLSMTPKTEGRQYSTGKLNEQFLSRVVPFVKRMWASLVGATSRAIKAADAALDILYSL